MIAAGFIAVAATGRLDLFSSALFASIMAAGWFLDTARIRQRIPGWALNCIVLAYLPFFFLDYRFLSRSLMMALIHLILFAAAIKLLTLSKDSDYFILYLISFAELIVASTLTMNIAFGVCFLLFLISGVSALILFEMSRRNADLQNQAIVQPLVVPKNLKGTPWELFSPFPARLLGAITVGISLLILAIAIPIFFLLPRIASGLKNQPSGKTQFISGFSERVDLGKSGSIARSDAVVMRIKISDSGSGVPAGLKWRGLAFQYYDGRSWKRTDLHRNPVSTQGQFFKLESSAQGTNLLFQTFFIEALSTEVIFAANKSLAVSRDVGMLQKDSAGGLYTTRAPLTKLRYSAISDLNQPNPDEIQNSEIVPPEVLSVYLQLPPSDFRITTLARQATKDAAGKYFQALALERYLRTHYKYSLELQNIPGGKDPVSVFLFDIKKGHCEYFASAMTIMLRTLGIPARLINGFSSGEYNRIGDHWTVRQYNAHSWVEAYFPSYGWVEFDPTPPEFPPQKPAIVRLFSNLIDAMDLWWWDSVLNYDFLKQYRILGGVSNAMDQLQRKTTNILEFMWDAIRNRTDIRGQKSLKPIGPFQWIAGIGAIAIVYCLWVGKCRRRIFNLLQRTMHRSNPNMAAHGFYRDALRLLNEKGMERSRGQTPLEFALRLEGHPAAAPFLILTRMYNEARFGPPGIALNSSDAAAQLRLLRSALRK